MENTFFKCHKTPTHPGSLSGDSDSEEPQLQVSRKGKGMGPWQLPHWPASSCARSTQTPEVEHHLSLYHQIFRSRSSQGLAKSVGSAASQGWLLILADTCGLHGLGAGTLGLVL